MAKKIIPKLKIEPVPIFGKESNFSHLSLLEHKREQYLCVINHISEIEVGAYILDYIERENIPLTGFMEIVHNWFTSENKEKTLSMYISKMGLTSVLSPIFRTFDTSYVSRIVSNFSSSSLEETSKVKRRRIAPIIEPIEIVIRK